MRLQNCTALILSALFAAGCLAGCGAMYDTSDVEDPAGVGTSAILGEAGTETLKRIYQDALRTAACRPAPTSPRPLRRWSSAPCCGTWPPP